MNKSKGSQPGKRGEKGCLDRDKEILLQKFETSLKALIRDKLELRKELRADK